ncbi:unnamed protein product [Lathyrus oleraceus]
MHMKIVFVVVFLAAMSTVLAHDNHHHVEAPAPASGATPASAPAPGPSSSDAASLGSILGASLFSFVAYYLNFHA